MSDPYSEAVESCLRVIAGARPEFRGKVFELQAADAFGYALKAGIEKPDIVYRLDAIGSGFGWTVEQRQTAIAAAVAKATQPAIEQPAQQRWTVDDPAPLDGDHRHDAAQADEGKKPKQANILIHLARDAALFHTADGAAFADIRVGAIAFALHWATGG